MRAIEPLPQPRPVPRRATAVGRAVGFVSWLSGLVLRLAAWALAGGVLVWAAVFNEVAPDDRVFLLMVLALAMLFAPVVLGLLGFALRSLAGLPARLREAPGQTRGRIADARRRLAEVAEARRRGFVSAIGALIRLGWTLRSSREVLEVAGAAVVPVTPGMLAAAAIAVIAGLVEVLAGAIALVWLVLAA